MKVCKKCLRVLAPTEFYKHSQMRDGLLSFCKSCVKVRITQYRKANLEQVREYDRIRNKTDERRRHQFLHSKAWKKRHPEKYRAHVSANNAVRSGKLQRQPCQVCGSRAEKHHPDYTDPLRVVWLCSRHHHELHRRYKD